MVKFMRYQFPRYPEGKIKAVTFSYDDGVPADERLAGVFDKYGMKCTFNFNCSAIREFSFSAEDIDRIFLSKGHEIAIHGAMHRANGNCRPAEGIRDALLCRLELEERCGRIIRGMAYPNSGITSMSSTSTYEKIKSYLTDLDIVYARTLGGDNDRFMLPDDFHAWMPSAHHTNPELMNYIDKFLAEDVDALYYSKRAPRLLYIWGHSYEFDRDDNWDLIEGACEKLGGRDDIWYATNIEIYDYITAYNSLVYSADGSIIYNPTLFKIWFIRDNDLYSIAPGEVLKI